MLSVGQNMILEHHIVHRRFVLKVGCVAVFIYQIYYFYRVNEQLHHILSKYPIFKVILSKEKVKVSPTRNKIYSHVQIPCKYHLEKTCDFNIKHRIFLHSCKNLAWHCKLRRLTIISIRIRRIQKHGVLHFSNIVYLLCTPFGKSVVVYTGPPPTLPTIRLFGRVTNAGFRCIPNFKLLQNIYKLIQR